MWLRALAFLAAAASPLAASAAPNDPVGTWLTDEGKGKVEISACGGRGQLCSKIVWLKDPNDSAGKPLRDMRNKNDAQRGRPIIGMPILTNLSQAGPTSWSGNIYNPEDGNTYKASMMMVSKDRIQLKGCAMFGLVCGEKNWTRTAPEKAKVIEAKADAKLKSAEHKAEKAEAAPKHVAKPAPEPVPLPVAESGEVVDEEAAQIEAAQMAEAENAAKQKGRVKQAVRADRAPAPVEAPAPAPVADLGPAEQAGVVSEAPVQAIVAKPVPAHAVAAAAPVPHGPVAREDMMWLAAPPNPEETVSGVPMQLEVPEGAPSAVDVEESAAGDEGDADPGAPPLPERAASVDEAAKAVEAAPKPAASRKAKPVRRAKQSRASKKTATKTVSKTATKTVSRKVTKTTKTRTAVAGSSTKRTPEKLPWLAEGETMPPPKAVKKPGSLKALLSPPKS